MLSVFIYWNRTRVEPEKIYPLVSYSKEGSKFFHTRLPSPPIVINNENFGIDYDYPPIEQTKGSVRVPILNYHHVAQLPASGSARDYYVSPQMFEKQMEYLKAKNYKTLSIQEFYDLLKTGKNPTQKSVLITFDDGNSDNYKYAFPILKKYGLVATFFVTSNRSGITSGQLQEMVLNGMDIGSHSRTHQDLTKLSDEDAQSEIVGSKYDLESMSQSKVKAISYPGCVANQENINLARSAGYILGFTCGKKIDHWPSNYYTIQRVHIYSNMENFKQRLSGIVEYTIDYR